MTTANHMLTLSRQPNNPATWTLDGKFRRFELVRIRTSRATRSTARIRRVGVVGAGSGDGGYAHG